MDLEYVASGCNHLRFTIDEFGSCPEAVKTVQTILDKSQGVHGHKYSLLFNGLTEVGLGKKMDALLRKHAYSIHADSGGLQIVTRGLESSDANRDKVYKIQSKYSDVAMSFDEIPVTVVGSQSSRFDLSNRFFDPALIKSGAKDSAKNLKRQIEVFRADQSKAKPFLIIQGNDADYYQQWLDIMLEELGDEYIPGVGGLAMGSAALGSGALEDVERAFALTQLKAPKSIIRHLHTLGVGSVKRLVPFFAFFHNGMLGNIEHMSYDSTTHTSGSSYGSYYLESGLLKLTRMYDENFFKMFHAINQYQHWHGITEFKTNEVYDAMCMQSNWAKNYVDKSHLRHAILHTFVFSSILNFTKDVQDIKESKDKLTEWMTDIGNNSYRMLYFVRDKKDFSEWKQRYSYDLPSLPVQSIAKRSVGLGALFE